MEGFLQVGASARVKVLMIDSADHVSGKTGLTLTIEESKDFANFVTITPTVIERGYGWYEVFLANTSTGFLGDYAMHVTAAGADPTDLKWQIVNGIPGTPTLSQIVNGVWNALTTDHSLIDSFGWRIQEMDGRVGAFLDAPVSGVPTANQNADALLKRDMSVVTGEAARSPLNALRALRNKSDIVAGTLTVRKEDDTAAAWTANVTRTPGADPITVIDPV